MGIIHSNIKVTNMNTPARSDVTLLSECIQEVKSLATAVAQAGDKMFDLAEKSRDRTERDVVLMDNVRNRFEKIASCFSNEVHLNIGGTRFTTSKDTLLAEPDSFFACMIRRSNTVKLCRCQHKTHSSLLAADAGPQIPMVNISSTEIQSFFRPS